MKRDDKCDEYRVVTKKTRMIKELLGGGDTLEQLKIGKSQTLCTSSTGKDYHKQIVKSTYKTLKTTNNYWTKKKKRRK